MLNPFQSLNQAAKRRAANAELAYLNDAVDLIDLEYRERELQRRNRRAAPFGRYLPV